MSILEEAVDSIRRRAMAMRAELALANELAKVASIDNAVSEAQGRLDAMRKQEDKEHAAIALRKSEAETEVEELKRKGAEHAAQMIEKAQAAARECRDDAEQDAELQKNEVERLVAGARAQVGAADNRLDALKTEHEMWGAKIVALQALHAQWGDKTMAAKAEHDRVQAVIADAKARLG